MVAITTIVPSSRLPTPCPGSLPSRATVTTISSPGIATGRIACASSCADKTVAKGIVWLRRIPPALSVLNAIVLG